MLNIYDILEKVYTVLDKFSILLMWLMMSAGCILLWYFVFAFVFSD